MENLPKNGMVGRMDSLSVILLFMTSTTTTTSKYTGPQRRTAIVGDLIPLIPGSMERSNTESAWVSSSAITLTLSVVERAQIANWFERSVSLKKELRIKWMGLLPIAHAHTLFIAYRMAKDPTFKAIPESEILRKAWEIQLTGSTTILKEIDVDKECLESLEEEMFERTERTGISGNWQWGLDVGHHQDGWDPSFGVPGKLG
jgi:hypothetical protein